MKKKVLVLHISKYIDGYDRLCNHKCLFCMEQLEPGESNNHLPSIDSLIDILEKFVIKNGVIDKIYISGGEPTMREDLLHIISIAKEYTKNIVLSTNCDYENCYSIIQNIKNSGITKIATSIHGSTSELHDRITGKKGSLLNTLHIIREYLQQGMEVTVNAVICSMNIGDMFNISNMFDRKGLNISKLTFTHYINHGNAFYHRELLFNVDEYSNEIKKTIDILGNLSYEVTFRDFPLCLDKRLKMYLENIDGIEIIKNENGNKFFVGEKAPNFALNKCNGCIEYDICPKYLVSNYKEV